MNFWDLRIHTWILEIFFFVLNHILLLCWVLRFCLIERLVDMDCTCYADTHGRPFVYGSFHWKCDIPDIYQIEKHDSRRLDISRHKFKLRFRFSLREAILFLASCGGKQILRIFSCMCMCWYIHTQMRARVLELFLLSFNADAFILNALP